MTPTTEKPASAPPIAFPNRAPARLAMLSPILSPAFSPAFAASFCRDLSAASPMLSPRAVPAFAPALPVAFGSSFASAGKNFSMLGRTSTQTASGDPATSCPSLVLCRRAPCDRGVYFGDEVEELATLFGGLRQFHSEEGARGGVHLRAFCAV